MKRRRELGDTPGGDLDLLARISLSAGTGIKWLSIRGDHKITYSINNDGNEFQDEGPIYQCYLHEFPLLLLSLGRLNMEWSSGLAPENVRIYGNGKVMAVTAGGM